MNNQEVDINQARERARAQAWTVQRILNELETIDLLDMHFRQQCIAQREELIPALLVAMRERESFARLKASLLLLRLNELGGTDGIIACLREDNDKLRIRALSALSMLPLLPLTEDAPMRWEKPVPIRREALFAELQSLLAHPDTQMGFLALKIVMKLELPAGNEMIRSLISHRSRKVRIEVLNWLARHGEDCGGLRAAKTLLFGWNGLFSAQFSSHDTYWVIMALTDYCEDEQPELARHAAELLAHFVRVNVRRPDNSTTNHISMALDGIAKAHYAKERELLDEVYRSSTKDWRQGVVLERLAEIEGEASINRLRSALADPRLRKSAAKGIASIAKRGKVLSLVEPLMSAAREETRSEVLGEIVNALIALGKEPAQLSLQFSDRLGPHDLMCIYWLTHGITPEAAAARLTQLEIIPPPTEDVMSRIEANWQKEQQPSDVVFALMVASNCLTGFDCEAGIVPVDYVGLMDRLFRISKGGFEAVSQQVDEATGKSEVQFIHNQKAYAFTAQNFGDWYDVNTVIHGLNEALHHAGVEERFFLLYTGDQTCIVTFAPEAAFRKVARELYLPLEENLESAMHRGIAYEEHVKRSLK